MPQFNSRKYNSMNFGAYDFKFAYQLEKEQSSIKRIDTDKSIQTVKFYLPHQRPKRGCLSFLTANNDTNFAKQVNQNNAASELKAEKVSGQG